MSLMPDVGGTTSTSGSLLEPDTHLHFESSQLEASSVRDLLLF